MKGELTGGSRWVPVTEVLRRAGETRYLSRLVNDCESYKSLRDGGIDPIAAEPVSGDVDILQHVVYVTGAEFLFSFIC